MGSKVSKAKRPTRSKTEKGIAPRIPLDIINEILDHFANDSDLRSLRACALISKSWVQPSQHRLFHTIFFAPWSATKWLKTSPVREASPAHHVRHLYLRIGLVIRIPKEFFKCIPWFTEVDRMTILGHGGVPLGSGGVSSSPEPSFWNLPKSVTSLTIDTDVITLVQVRDIIAQLPNLKDLALLDSLVEPDRGKLRGIGTVLTGRFCGRLKLSGGGAGEDVVNMLLEIPSGLHFSELVIRCTHSRLPPWAVRLAEACSKTLVKLSHTVDYNREPHRNIFERSFDFSKFPNIQEVTFGFSDDLRLGGLPWIPMALSTLRRTTSPHLSVIKLNFSSINRTIENIITDMGNDLRRIADEIARIGGEFQGAVKFIVVPDSHFELVLNILNIVQYHDR